MTDRDKPDRRQIDLPPLVERRLSPMARRVLSNKADGLRTGGDRPMGSDHSAERNVA